MRIIQTLLWCAIVTFGQQLSETDESLLTSARKGDLAGVQAALEKGANIEAKTRHGITPLYFAASNGHDAVVKLLIGKGADINVTDTFYKAPLMSWVISRNHSSTALLLVENGSKQAVAALPSAAGAGMTQVVESILAKNQPAPDVLTEALQAAVNAKQEATAAALRKAGAQDAPKADFAVEPATLALYPGTYRDERSNELIISIKDGKLFAGAGGQSFEFGALDPATFQSLRSASLKLKFNQTGGKVQSVTLMQGQQSTEYHRVAAEAK